MRSCLALVLTTLCLAAVEGAGPGVMPPPGRGLPQTMMMRPGQSFEVERLVMKTGDGADLAKWAELAGLGYHVVSAILTSEGSVLFLERSSQPGGRLQLPAVIEKDAAAAETLRTKIQALIAERLQALRPQAPAPAPAPAAK